MVYAVRSRLLLAPASGHDQYGNQLVRPGGKAVDETHNLPHEIWLADPRIELVLVTPGEFVMGSGEGEEGRYSDEGPARTVRVTSPFYMGKYEITQKQWSALMKKNPSAFPGDRNPVDSVSWMDGVKFLARLNRATTDRLHVPLQFGLPSEAEMEYALRAGTTSRFSTGDGESGLPSAAWFRANAGGTSKPVGRKAPNPWGLYDLHGNVLEWCADTWHDGYAGAPGDETPWERDGLGRVLRGGSFLQKAFHCRSAVRFKAMPDGREKEFGLRIVLRFRPR
jgi:formylglycine-generating enzyme required for sulfatase activity